MSKIRVLVVDDSALMRKLIPQILARDSDIEVVGTAMDGAFGLKKIADLKPDVVTLDLLPSSNDQIKPNLERYLKPGARVVSHDFQIRGWKPAKVEQALAHNREHTIYVYRMPPR